MPRITYTPEGATPRHWDFDFGKLLSPERIVIEKMTDGRGWESVKARFFLNHGDVIHAFLYVLMKRDMPTLKPAEVVFCDDEILLDLTDAEAIAYVEQARVHLPTVEDADEAAELQSELDRLTERLGDLLETEPGDPKDGA